jgi:hypothetical protein
MGGDPSCVEGQDGQLGRRAANEAVEQEKVLRLVRGQRVSGTIAGSSTKGKPGFDLEVRGCPGLKRADGLDRAAADEERSEPPGLDRRREQAELQPPQSIQPAQALDDVLERLDPVP